MQNNDVGKERTMRVLITGGSRGIGKAIATEVSDAGHELLLVSKNASNLDRAVEEIQSNSKNKILSRVCDVG